MDTRSQDVRDATNAVATVLDCVAKVRCVVDYHGLDDQLERLGPMLTNYIAVYFAAQPVLFKAVHRLRAASPELPPRIGEHSAASYHELALYLGEELIWRMLSGMNAHCMQAVLDALTGLGQLPNGSIPEAESALNELGGIENPAAVFAEMREHSLTSCDLADLLRCVLKEGAIAAVSAGETEQLAPSSAKPPEALDHVRSSLSTKLREVFDVIWDRGSISLRDLSIEAWPTIDGGTGDDNARKAVGRLSDSLTNQVPSQIDLIELKGAVVTAHRSRLKHPRQN